MKNYLHQLHADLESAILTRWRKCPPHYYEMGVPDPWLKPPTGWEGPPFGFGHGEGFVPYTGEEGEATDDDWLNLYPEEPFANEPESAATATAPIPEESASTGGDDTFKASIEEMETWMESKPELTMFYHFGLEAEQFPPAERLTDEELEALVFAMRRLWAAFNFTAVLPDHVPARVVYPILLERMGEGAMVMSYGHIGVEFCNYEPSECPFGLEWCSCKEFLEEPQNQVG